MNQSIRFRTAARLAVAALIATAGAARADNTATQDISISISAVNEIEVGAAQVVISMASVTAGNALTGTGSSTYAITTNSGTSKKITAHLLSALTNGLSLSANLQAPSTGSSAGAVTLSTTDSNVVTSIEAVNESNLTISYSAAATVSVAAGSYDADVVYTVVNDS